MLQTFSVTFSQMVILFLFIFVGVLLRRYKKGSEIISSALSQMEVMVCLPALCFSTFSKNFTLDSLSTEKWILLASLCILFGGIAISLPLSRLFGKNPLERDVYLYSFIVTNLAYLGYPLVQSIWGDEMLYHFMMFTMPFNVFIYTVGINLLNPKRTWSLKGIVNPTMIALVLGMAVGLTGVTLPEVVLKAADLAGGCLAPLAMILTGCVLGGLPLSRSFFAPKPIIGSLIRLVAIPLFALVILRIFGVPSLVSRISVLYLAMPFGLNSVIFPEAFGGDSASGARLCFFSHLFSILTVPLIIGLTVYLFP